MPPIESANDLTAQVNLTPLDKLGETPDVPVEPVSEPEDDPLKARVLDLEIKQHVDNAIPAQEKAEPNVFNIHVAPGATPRVDIQNDVHVPEQKQPIVNVTNEVEAPIVQNSIKAPDVKVTVPVPDVKVENTVNVPCEDGNKKVVFNRDGKGNITDAVLEDE